jgi:hypothetical protein
MQPLSIAVDILCSAGFFGCARWVGNFFSPQSAFLDTRLDATSLLFLPIIVNFIL